MAEVLVFAYAEDMLSQHMQSHKFPSTLKGKGQLRGWKLTFVGNSDKWKGGAANIVETNVDTVWGAIWKISAADLVKLDQDNKGYKQVRVRVLESDAVVLDCVTYTWADASAKVSKPSGHLRCVVDGGAIERKLPIDYMRKLEKIEDNGYCGKVDADLALTKPGNFTFRTAANFSGGQLKCETNRPQAGSPTVKMKNRRFDRRRSRNKTL